MLTARELEVERRLVQAAQREPRRFEQLYERSFDRIYAYALNRTANRTAAEDVTAETFRRAFQSLQQFEWRGVPFASWLFRIAGNATNDYFRRSGGDRASLDLVDDEPGEGWEAQFVEIEDRIRLNALVSRLPAVQQRVVVMRFAQDRSIKEIAGELGRSDGAIKQLQFRALEHLRSWLEEEDD